MFLFVFTALTLQQGDAGPVFNPIPTPIINPVSLFSSTTYSDIGLFVIIAFSGAIFNTFDMINWFSITFQMISVQNYYPEEVYSWRSVTYGNGTFVAVASSRFMTSSDGFNWELSLAPFSSWCSVIFANGLFVAVASSGEPFSRIILSKNGKHWDAIKPNDIVDYSIIANNFWKSITFGSGSFVAVSEFGPRRVIRSSQSVRTWKRSRLFSW